MVCIGYSDWSKICLKQLLANRNSRYIYQLVSITKMADSYAFTSKISSTRVLSWSEDDRIAFCTDTSIKCLVKHLIYQCHNTYLIESLVFKQFLDLSLLSVTVWQCKSYSSLRNLAFVYLWWGNAGFFTSLKYVAKSIELFNKIFTHQARPNHGPTNHGLATSDVGETITNNILSSSLSAYAVRIGRYSQSVDRW